jgi:hypothetical protein
VIDGVGERRVGPLDPRLRQPRHGRDGELWSRDADDACRLAGVLAESAVLGAAVAVAGEEAEGRGGIVHGPVRMARHSGLSRRHAHHHWMIGGMIGVPHGVLRLAGMRSRGQAAAEAEEHDEGGQALSHQVARRLLRPLEA